MSSCRVLEWWCHLSSVDNISKWFELPCASVFAIFSLRSRAVQNFTRFSQNCFNSEKKYFALSRPSVPSSQLEKSPSQLKTGTEVGYRTMEGISRCQKNLISHYCQKSLISHCQKHLICGQICDSRGSGYRCFELEDIGVKVVVCLRITTLQRQPATAGGKEGGQGWSKGGKGEIVVDKRGLVRYVDLNGGKTGGLGNCLHWSEVWRLWELLAHKSLKTKLWEKKIFNPCEEIFFLSFGGTFGKRVLLMLKWKC